MGASLMGLQVKNMLANAGAAGDVGLILGSGRFGGGNGKPHQYYCLKHMDRGTWKATVHRVAKNQKD